MGPVPELEPEPAAELEPVAEPEPVTEPEPASTRQEATCVAPFQLAYTVVRPARVRAAARRAG